MTYEGIRADVLKALPSPGKHGHEIETDEFTLMGAHGKADFARLKIDLSIDEGKCPELKSVKQYLAQYRNCVMSYERAATLLRDHFVEVYDPENVDITLEFKVRGGIKSTVNTWAWNREAEDGIEEALHAGDVIDISV